VLEQFQQGSGVDGVLLENFFLCQRVPEAGDDDMDLELVHGDFGHLRIHKAPDDGSIKLLACLTRRLLHCQGRRTTVEDWMTSLEILIQGVEYRGIRAKNLHV